MTMHKAWTDRLSDYLDGELGADEHRAVESHLRECAACTAVHSAHSRRCASTAACSPGVSSPSR